MKKMGSENLKIGSWKLENEELERENFQKIYFLYTILDFFHSVNIIIG